MQFPQSGRSNGHWFAINSVISTLDTAINGASRAKKSLAGWIFNGGSPDEDIIDNLDVLRQRSCDLYMGGAVLATGALKTDRTNVVGTGLRLKPVIDAGYLGLSEEQVSKLKRQIQREFSLWADSNDCDAARRNNFYDLQQLAFLSQLDEWRLFRSSSGETAAKLGL